ncbi:subtilisin family serine protease [Streptomyces spectabilis]|nr:subtilisin family serine protease [Streptomyces spectabilis]
MKRTTRRRAAAVLSAATLAGGLQLGAAPATGAAPRGGPAAGDLRLAGAGEAAVPDGWIVVLKDTRARAVPGVARDLVERSGGARLGHVYRAALHGFSATMSRARAERVSADSRVAYVRQDTRVRLDAKDLDERAIDETQPNAPWGLDRIDQRLLPLSGTYTYRTTAPDVRVYVIDTGLRTTHQEFGGRASVGVDTVGDGQNGNDCHGHGTHVGGIAAGRTYGVAKQARVVAVRVLNCQGSATTAGVVAGVDWVTGQKARPAVANMSIGGQASDVLDNAVRNSIRSGVTYAVSAGSAGSSTGACSTSPARLPEAVTVGASDRADRRASSSNHGQCVSLFAPGVQIPSAWKDSDTSTNTISGTSMATAHVAGAAALHLAFRPADTPAQVKRGLVDNATTGVLQGTPPVVPNKLLYTLYLPKPGHSV